MAYLLSHGTAVQWLRQNQSVDRLAVRQQVPYHILEASRTRLQPHLPHLAGLTMPLHLLVSQADNRRPSLQTHPHLLSLRQTTYPAIPIANDLYCSPPELAFLQMASLLDSDQLLFLGMELCGRYGIRHDQVFMRDQICSPQMIAAQIAKAPRLRGRRQALAAAESIIPNAGSPMEATLALILTLPIERGGFALPCPLLNYQIPVPDTLRSLWPAAYITPDLLWIARMLVIEYDSNLHHTTESRIASDALRRDVLTELGFRVITVTGHHMERPLELERIARLVANAFGTEIPFGSDEERAQRIALQAKLRRIASDPSELLAFPPQPRQITRSWRQRTPRERAGLRD